jgi:hypothetical protein
MAVLVLSAVMTENVKKLRIVVFSYHTDLKYSDDVVSYDWGDFRVEPPPELLDLLLNDIHLTHHKMNLRVDLQQKSKR